MEGLRKLGRATVFLFVLSAVLSSSSGAAVHSFSEDFSTKLYCDSLNTTAWWDTVAGEVKLYPFELTLEGSYNTPQWAVDVAIAGDYAYVADLDGGLLVIDISDPTSPTLAAAYNTPGNSRAVAVSGNYAYLADDAVGGLQIIDISNPAAPSLAASYDTPGSAYGVAVAGDYAYVADYDSLYVVNISDPTVPTRAGSYGTPGNARDVTISGDLAFVTDDAQGLQILDITIPEAPTLTGSYDTPNLARETAVSGDYAYVADYGSGLQVIHISDPSVPVRVGTYDTPGGAYGVAISGDYAYVADYTEGLLVLDISNPASPAFANSYDTPGHAYRVTVCGDYAYLADGAADGLLVMDVADPVMPPVTVGSQMESNAMAVTVSGDCAYVTDWNRLAVLDITDPTSPSPAGELLAPGDAYAVAVSGDHAFVALDTGLLSVDISDPTAPDSAGFCENVVVDAWIWSIAISGDYAYVAGDNEADPGFYVFDISDPTNPTEVAAKATPDLVRGLAVSGDYLYVAAWSEGLIAYDISNPASPDSVGGGADNFGYLNSVAVSGDYAYIFTTRAFQVVDISNPLSHSIVGTYDSDFETGVRIALAGDYAFAACRGLGLMVLDISDSTDPTLAGICDTPNFARDISIAGDHAFVTDGMGGLQVIQIFERDSNLDSNAVRSLLVFEGTDEISAVKLTPAETGSINWYVSADSGASWDLIPGDDDWYGLASLGTDLLWRADLVWGASGVSPSCSQLDMEWMNSVAEIDSVHDVPNDQGGWVRVRFDRSGLDVAGGEPGARATGYYVHRRIDDVSMINRILEEGERLSEERPVLAGSDGDIADGARGGPPALPSSFGGAQAYVLDDRTYFVSDASTTDGFPDGTWESIGRIPATQEEQYYCLSPSVEDSAAVMEYTVFCVSTHTSDPAAYFMSSPDSGYSVDNLAPALPQNITGVYSYPPPQLLITWSPNTEADLSHYAVYKGTFPGFVPDVGNRIGEPTDTFLVDTSFNPNTDNYYKVSALDIHWNESEFALLGPDGISGVGETPSVPEVTLLEQNIPNPFNPVTVIRFSIADAGWVVLRVFDVTGRPVRTLVKGRREINRYEVTWDGRDDGGRLVASGVYLYELDAPGYLETKKMVLVR